MAREQIICLQVHQVKKLVYKFQRSNNRCFIFFFSDKYYSSSLSLPKTDAIGTFGFLAALLPELCTKQTKHKGHLLNKITKCQSVIYGLKYHEL